MDADNPFDTAAPGTGSVAAPIAMRSGSPVLYVLEELQCKGNSWTGANASLMLQGVLAPLLVRGHLAMTQRRAELSTRTM